jgi:hypothetical protein
MRVRSSWSGASAEAPTEAVQHEVVQFEVVQFEVVPPIEAGRSFEEEQS